MNHILGDHGLLRHMVSAALAGPNCRHNHYFAGTAAPLWLGSGLCHGSPRPYNEHSQSAVQERLYKIRICLNLFSTLPD
jgi:hypothetical protein